MLIYLIWKEYDWIMMYSASIGPMRVGGSIGGGKSHGGFKNKYVTLIFES